MNPTRISIALGNGETVLSDPGAEYVVAGQLGSFLGNGGVLLAQVYDDVVRQFGPRVYELIEYESAAAAALWMLKAGALGDGLQLTPKVTALPGQVVSKRKQRSEIKLSAEVYESCERAVDGLGEGVVYDTLFALLGGLGKGCKLAEQVFTLSESGEDRGRQMPTVFEIRPNWAWAFQVDPHMRVDEYRCWTDRGWAAVAADHFTRFTWQPVDGDPRGSSILRGCYTPFNAMMQAYPDYGEFLRKFASASLVLEAAPGAQDVRETDPVTGANRTVTVQQQLVRAGRDFKNHSVLALPPGAKAHPFQSSGDGSAFLKGFDFFERQIFRSVILSVRPMQEAQHGSKADSESGLDVFGLAVGSVRKPLARAFRGQFLRRFVELNWGPEVAARHTPPVGFGASEHVSPDLMTAFADAWSKGLFDEEHRPFIWSKVGAPTPEGWTPDPSEPRPGAAPQPAQGDAETGPGGNPQGTPAGATGGKQGPPPGKPGDKAAAPPPKGKAKAKPEPAPAEGAKP